MTLPKFEFRHLPPCESCESANPTKEGAMPSRRFADSQDSQGVTREIQHSRFGVQANADALTLASMIDDDPHVSLDAMRARAGAEGITGDRWAFGLVALPEAYNERRGILSPQILKQKDNT